MSGVYGLGSSGSVATSGRVATTPAGAGGSIGQHGELRQAARPVVDHGATQRRHGGEHTERRAGREPVAAALRARLSRCPHRLGGVVEGAARHGGPAGGGLGVGVHTERREHGRDRRRGWKASQPGAVDIRRRNPVTRGKRREPRLDRGPVPRCAAAA
ncbi:MAG: hypothetical protein R2698_10490 [Microthrixaceae bacterium]